MIKLNNFKIGNSERLTIFGGVNVIESKELIFEVAEEFIKNSSKLKFNFVFKASFDKANRSSLDSYRGPGLEDGLKILSELKQKYNLPILTDIHEPHQAKPVSEVCDIIQIPAFLCRQTDLLIEAALHFNKINVKKGQWLSPEKVEHIVEKIKYVNPDAEVWITERGTTFGYNKLLVDFSAVDTLKSYADKVILDCTHSTQSFNKNNYTSGNRELAKKYIQVAKTFGFDGIFAEIHPEPDNAISDKESQIELSWIKDNLSLYL